MFKYALSKNAVSKYALSKKAVSKYALSKNGCPDVLCPNMICPKSVLSKKELPQIANPKNVQSKIDFAENAKTKTFPCQNVLSKKLVLDQMCPIQKCPAIKRKEKPFCKKTLPKQGKTSLCKQCSPPFPFLSVLSVNHTIPFHTCDTITIPFVFHSDSNPFHLISFPFHFHSISIRSPFDFHFVSISFPFDFYSICIPFHYIFSNRAR